MKHAQSVSGMSEKTIPVRIGDLSRYEKNLITSQHEQLDLNQSIEYFIWIGKINNDTARARIYYEQNIFSPFVKCTIPKESLDNLGYSQNDLIHAKKEPGAKATFSKCEVPQEKITELERKITELGDDFEIYYEIRNSNCPSHKPRYDTVELRVSLDKNECYRDAELGGGHLPSESKISDENKSKSLFEDMGFKERDPIRIKVSNESIIGLNSPLDQAVVKEYLLYCEENDEGDNARFSVYKERTAKTELGEINLWNKVIDVLKCKTTDHFILSLKEKEDKKWLEISRFDYTEKEKENIAKEIDAMFSDLESSFRRFSEPKE